MAAKRNAYTVLVPFPHRGHWTAKGQSLELLRVEAAQLLRAKRIELAKPTQATTKAAAKKAD